MITRAYLLVFSFLVAFGCRPLTEKEQLLENLRVLEEDFEGSMEADSVALEDKNNIQSLIQLTLLDQFKEELEWIDSLGRTYNYAQVDLNEDGNLEILVGMTGPFFCGSGGCTLLLLTDQGDIITQFSVVKYPVFVDNESSNGWKNLILYSGGENRVVQFNGETYPSNPSTLPVFERDVENLEKLLDWEISETYSF
ncbi:hypothetical protein [Algoriphagus limi]|uniref:Lipoprotein n=1 Tax=Algoriphagus limi TaxID=2975273 RepID=A0ABT2G6I0_9BACT|nr:hypothetical protein [Algoriphagus limi]MCS5490856.1 hypothetical protein [Algoriphagus limi]